MKKIILVFSLLIITSFNLFSQADCNGVTCQDGWTLKETGWV
jgi:predicted small secreted protein